MYSGLYFFWNAVIVYFFLFILARPGAQEKDEPAEEETWWRVIHPREGEQFGQSIITTYISFSFDKLLTVDLHFNFQSWSSISVIAKI